jgi:hypothetical protein
VKSSRFGSLSQRLDAALPAELIATRRLVTAPRDEAAAVLQVMTARDFDVLPVDLARRLFKLLDAPADQAVPRSLLVA